MHIIEIEIVNNRAIKCFKSKLNGSNMEIAGETGSGKTTAISALWDILERRSDSLRHGEKSGHVRIKIGDGDKLIVATRKNTTKTSTITLMDSNGDQVSIKDFKQMISELSVNPHKIMDMRPKEQVNVLLKSANMGDFDIEEVDKNIIRLVEDRLNAHRKADLIKPGPEVAEAERVDVSELLAEHKAALEANASNEKRRDLLIEIKEDKKRGDDEVERMNIELQNLRERIHTVVTDTAVIAERITKGEAVIAELTDIDTDAIVEKITTASETNDLAAQREQWVLGKENHDIAVAEHIALDKQVKELTESKKTALNNAQWPIEGLSIVDGAVVFKDCLLSNLGDSEKMLVCAALAVNDIKSHPLKVVRMDGVESMSSDDFGMLKALFNDHGIQVLSTRVSRGDVDDCEIVITDGEYGVEVEKEAE